MEVNGITFTVTRAADADETRAETVRGEFSCERTLPEYFVRPELFGVPVWTGPVAYHIPRA